MDSSIRRRYPARLFVDHPPRRSLLFHTIEIATMFAIPLGIVGILFVRARLRAKPKLRMLQTYAPPVLTTKKPDTGAIMMRSQETLGAEGAITTTSVRVVAPVVAAISHGTQGGEKTDNSAIDGTADSPPSSSRNATSIDATSATNNTLDSKTSDRHSMQELK